MKRFEDCLFLAYMAHNGWARWSGPWEGSISMALKMAEKAHPRLQFAVVTGADLGTVNEVARG